MTMADILAKAQSLFALTDHVADFEHAADAVLHGRTTTPLIGILKDWLQ